MATANSAEATTAAAMSGRHRGPGSRPLGNKGTTAASATSAWVPQKPAIRPSQAAVSS